MKFFNSNQAASASGKPGSRKQWLIAGAGLAMASCLTIAGVSMAEDRFQPDHLDHQSHHSRHGMSFDSLLNDSVIMNRIIEKVIDHVVPEGSAQQKTELGTIVKATLQDLRPIHEQNKALKGQIKSLLQQPVIDHAALEQWRQDEMHLADTASKRILQAVTACAEILTPEQRVKLADQLEKRHG